MKVKDLIQYLSAYDLNTEVQYRTNHSQGLQVITTLALPTELTPVNRDDIKLEEGKLILNTVGFHLKGTY